MDSTYKLPTQFMSRMAQNTIDKAKESFPAADPSSRECAGELMEQGFKDIFSLSQATRCGPKDLIEELYVDLQSGGLARKSDQRNEALVGILSTIAMVGDEPSFFVTSPAGSARCAIPMSCAISTASGLMQISCRRRASAVCHWWQRSSTARWPLRFSTLVPAVKPS